MAKFGNKKYSQSMTCLCFNDYPHTPREYIDCVQGEGIVKVYVGTKVIFCGFTKPFVAKQTYHFNLKF